MSPIEIFKFIRELIENYGTRNNYLILTKALKQHIDKLDLEQQIRIRHCISKVVGELTEEKNIELSTQILKKLFKTFKESSNTLVSMMNKEKYFLSNLDADSQDNFEMDYGQLLFRENSAGHYYYPFVEDS